MNNRIPSIAVFILVCIHLLFPHQSFLSGNAHAQHRRHRQSVLEPFRDTQGNRWADSVLATLTLRQRLAQMMVTFTYSNASGRSVRTLRNTVSDDGIGGVIISKGTVQEAARLCDSIQSWASIPVLISADFEYGLTMRLEGATEFPSAMALGATREPGLAFAMGRAIAQEARTVGVHQNYAPVCDVNNNPANPVINIRSFGESPSLVAVMAGAYAQGLQAGGVIATAKHFPGHGDTETDSHSHMPAIFKCRKDMDSLELAPFRYLIQNGILSVMTAHLAVPAITGDSTVPATFSPRAIDTVLKRDLRFSGLVVSDALNMGAIVNTYGSIEAVRRAIDAGVDVLLIPSKISAALDTLTRHAETDSLLKASIDASARKILQYKYWLRKNTPVQNMGLNSPGFRLLADSIARCAVTLVKNDTILPFQEDSSIATQAVFLLHGKSTSEGEEFLDEAQKRFPIAKSYMAERALSATEMNAIIDSLRYADRVLIASFAGVRSQGDPAGVSGEQKQLLQAVSKLGKPIVFLAMQSPYTLETMPKADAMLCTYDKSMPSISAAVDALTGILLPTGKLPVSIPGVAPYGTGLQYRPIAPATSATPADTMEMHCASDSVTIPEPSLASSKPDSIASPQPPQTDTLATPMQDVDHASRYGSQNSAFRVVDSMILEKINEHAFPGAQLVVGNRNGIIYQQTYGTLTYDPDAPDVDSTTMYDIASLTKVVATTTAIMKLTEQGKIKLTDPVVQYIPEFGTHGKRDVKIWHLLTHTSGLPPFKLYWQKYSTRQEVLEDIYDLPLSNPPGEKMVYSDLGFITLANVAATAAHTPIDRYMDSLFFRPLRMRNTMYTPPARLTYRCAPTENDTYWRKRMLQGTVHDENAALLGGIAGHAGLFSTAGDIARFVRMLMNGGILDGKRYLKAETIAAFTTAQAGAGGRALGWDTRSESGSSSGQYFSPGSYGHTGFTGTSIWIDPKADVFVVVLTNRVHPTRENKALPRFRAPLHDVIRMALKQTQ